MGTGNTPTNATPSPLLTGPQKALKFVGRQYLIVTLVILLIIGRIANPAFLTAHNITGFLVTISIYGLLAIGQSLVMLSSDLNLTLGASMAFSPILAMWIADKIYQMRGVNIVVGGVNLVGGLALIVVLTLLISMLIGFVCGFLRVTFNVSSLIITLGMMYVLQGGSYVISKSNIVFLSRIANVNILGTKTVLGVFPICFLIFAAVGLVFMFLMKYTRFGPYTYATGGNEKAARYSGVKTKQWKVLMFTLSGLCSGLATMVYTSRMESLDPIQGTGMQFYALSIAVIGGISVAGGKGSMLNTMIASGILVVAMNIMQMIGLASWYQTISMGIIIVIAAARAARPAKV